MQIQRNFGLVILAVGMLSFPLTSLAQPHPGPIVPVDSRCAIPPAPTCPNWNISEPPAGVSGFSYNVARTIESWGRTAVDAGYEANPGGAEDNVRYIDYTNNIQLQTNGAERSKFDRIQAVACQSNELNYSSAVSGADAGYRVRATPQFIELCARTCSFDRSEVGGDYHFFLDAGSYDGTDGYSTWYGEDLMVRVPFQVGRAGVLSLDALHLDLNWAPIPYVPEYWSGEYIEQALIKTRLRLYNESTGQTVFEYSEDDYQLDGQELGGGGIYELGWDVGDPAPEFSVGAGDYMLEITYENAAIAYTSMGLMVPEDDYPFSQVTAQDRLYMLLRFKRFNGGHQPQPKALSPLP